MIKKSNIFVVFFVLFSLFAPASAAEAGSWFSPRTYFSHIWTMVSSGFEAVGRLFNFAFSKEKLSYSDEIGDTNSNQGSQGGSLEHPQISNDNYQTPLHSAVARGQLERVKELLKNGADANIADKNGATPLLVAVKHYDDEDETRQEILSLLIESGCIKTATKNLKADYVKVFVKKFIEPFFKQNGIQYSGKETVDELLNKIIQANVHEEGILSLLVQLGAKVNAQDENDRAPLHLAAEKNLLGAVKELIENDAEINIKDHLGKTALHLAIEKGHLEVVEELIKNGADVDRKEDLGWTPLHLAIEKGHLKMVEELIKNGADVNSKEELGRTPLHIAKDTALVKMLLENGADNNARDNEGRTPLHFAVLFDFFPKLTALLETEAEIDLQDEKGKTPLHLALENKNYFLARKLLDAKAKSNIQDNDGLTALHLVMMDSCILDPNLLALHHELPLDICDNKGRSPLHIAVRKNNIFGVDFLLKKGANTALKDGKGRTVLDIPSTFTVIKTQLEKSQEKTHHPN